MFDGSLIDFSSVPLSRVENWADKTYDTALKVNLKSFESLTYRKNFTLQSDTEFVADIVDNFSG